MNNNQNYQQNGQWQQPSQGYQNNPDVAWQQPQQNQPKKKSKVGLIILIVFLFLLPIIILVFVMLLSMGVLIYNQSQGVVSDAVENLDYTSISLFNSKYSAYAGENKSMSHVIGMVQTVKVNNMYEDHKVDITLELKDGTTYGINDINSSVLSATGKYDIKISD